MAKDMMLAFLFDLYGELLSPRQREIFDGYYNEDLSLSELSDAYGITRQGVLHTIQTVEHKLRETEEKLGFSATLLQTKSWAEEIERLAQTGQPAEQIIQLAKRIQNQ